MSPKSASFAPTQASLNEYFSQGVSMPSIRPSKRALKTKSENLSIPSSSTARKRKVVEDVATVKSTKRRKILTMANVVEKGNTGLLTPPETVRPRKTVIRRRSNIQSSSPVPDTPTFKSPLVTIHSSTFVQPRTPSPRRQRYTRSDVIASSETPEQLNRSAWPSEVTNDGGYNVAEDVVPSSQTQLDRLDVIPSSQTQAHFTSPESPIRARVGYNMNERKWSSPLQAITRTSSKPILGDFEIPATQLSDWVVPCSQTESTSGVQLADQINIPSTWQSSLAPWSPVPSNPDWGFDIPPSQPIGEVVPSSQIDSQDLSARSDFEIPGTQYEMAVSPCLTSVLPTKDLEMPFAQHTPFLVASLPHDSTCKGPDFSQASLTAEQMEVEYSSKQLLSIQSRVHGPEHPRTSTSKEGEAHTTLEPSQYEFPSSPTEPDTDDFDLTIRHNENSEIEGSAQALAEMAIPETQVEKHTYSEDQLASSSQNDLLISRSVHPAVQDFFDMLDENRDFSMGGTLDSDFLHSSYVTQS